MPETRRQSTMPAAESGHGRRSVMPTIPAADSGEDRRQSAMPFMLPGLTPEQTAQMLSASPAAPGAAEYGQERRQSTMPGAEPGQARRGTVLPDAESGSGRRQSSMPGAEDRRQSTMPAESGRDRRQSTKPAAAPTPAATDIMVTHNDRASTVTWLIRNYFEHLQLPHKKSVQSKLFQVLPRHSVESIAVRVFAWLMPYCGVRRPPVWSGT
jgi:hypothetical protein